MSGSRKLENAQDAAAWLSGGGEMGALIRSINWADTPLGPVESWPQSLKTTVSLCLASTFPILIAWGPQRVQLYNDSYRPIAGAKHPQSMGQAFNECWASALPAVGAVVDRAQAGEGSYVENLQMFLDRHGYLEEAFMTFSFSPIRDESGRVGGLFHPITEVTDKMIGSRRTQVLRQLAAQLANARTLSEVWELTAREYDHFTHDVPFLLLYRFDTAAARATLAGAVGVTSPSEIAPEVLSCSEHASGLWPVQRLLRERQTLQVDNLETAFGTQSCGPYPELPRTALMLPVQPPGAAAPVACLIAGVSARRALDATYRSFFETFTATFTSAIASVLAYEQEQRRAEELAALDRAKTAFFSNVSHEFRTPLTLILGPTEDALASPEQALRGADLLTVHRNELRLLKLVNTLLDFSRIEAGRAQASYEPMDLATLTGDLASAFRSLIERAGLTLATDCPPLPEPIWVDHEMWEKVVLNLLSNAFKFTFVGGIAVRQSWHDDHVKLSVSDTGTGMAADVLPRIFERFHRVEGAQGRSYEGSGIGLALVQELVRLHGGSIRVDSALGRGTTFTVTIPTGKQHLPQDRVQSARTLSSTETRAEAFVREAEAWLEQASAPTESTPLAEPSESAAHTPAVASSPAATRTLRVLVADDNADMRNYIRRLLERQFHVQTVADGEAALRAIHGEPPDLVLSDVMMPRLDGFGLLRTLQSSPATKHIPVILLSARAGEEARIEGIQAGASDYLVKPFVARELVARVESSIAIAGARARLAEVLEAMGDAFYVLDRDWRFVLVNTRHEHMVQRSRAQMLGKNVWQLFPAAAAPGTKYWVEFQRCMKERVPVQFYELYAPLDTWTDVRAYPTEEGIAVFVRNVTEEKRAEIKLRQQSDFEQQLVGIVSHDLRNPLSAIQLGTTLLMEQPGQTPDTLKTAARIASSTDRAIRLVRDLLDFTQARLGGGIHVQPSATNLHVLTRHVLEEIQQVHRGRVLELELQGDGHGLWDPDRLEQVVTNLVTNACKYSPADSPVKVSVAADGDEVVLRVHNQGAPIPESMLQTIFEPMTRGSSPSDRSGRSVGLGLYIVKHIVAAHGGEVAVTSDISSGTVFAVRLPRFGSMEPRA
jgi:PAS domain S-box-containing protein